MRERTHKFKLNTIPHARDMQRPLTLSYIKIFEVRMRKGINAHARITREIQKSTALAGTLFFAEKGITLIYAMWRIDLFLFRVDLRGIDGYYCIVYVYNYMQYSSTTSRECTCSISTEENLQLMNYSGFRSSR